MKIENLMKFTTFFQYAGVKPGRGHDLAPGQCTSELETLRFMDVGLQRDLKLGKIKIHLTEADKAILGITAVEAIVKADNKVTEEKAAVNDVVLPLTVEEIPLVKEEVKPEAPKPVAPVVEAPKVDGSVPSLANLNSKSSGMPAYPQAGVPKNKKQQYKAGEMKV